jgi:hypothetical protein
MSDSNVLTPEPLFGTPERFKWMQNRCSFVPDFLACL